jgi:hypothetical protein
MRSFTAEDSARFHGRNKEVQDLLGRLRDGQRELYVIGPSGSGKSSLVAAGLVPSLRRSPELAGGSFLVQQIRPGADPTAALEGALEATASEQTAATQWLGDAVGRLLVNHPGHDRLLIFIDQLEELFTTAETNTRAAFIAAIRALRSDVRVALVLTLRADFYGSLMESALWADLDGQLSRLDVSPLRGDKLRLAVEEPARALGVYFEPVLVERLLHDMADEPGALPLLQDTLLDLWHHRARNLLRLVEYNAMGDGVQTGLAVTVARRADGAHSVLRNDGFGRPEACGLPRDRRDIGGRRRDQLGLAFDSLDDAPVRVGKARIELRAIALEDDRPERIVEADAQRTAVVHQHEVPGAEARAAVVLLHDGATLQNKADEKAIAIAERQVVTRPLPRHRVARDIEQGELADRTHLDRRTKGSRSLARNFCEAEAETDLLSPGVELIAWVESFGRKPHRAVGRCSVVARIHLRAASYCGCREQYTIRLARGPRAFGAARQAPSFGGQHSSAPPIRSSRHSRAGKAARS